MSTGDTDRVQELIQHNPSLKDQTDEKGWIPLHVGCASGQLECVKLVAVSGGNLEQETPTGYTSMHLAAMNGHVNCMMVSNNVITFLTFNCFLKSLSCVMFSLNRNHPAILPEESTLLKAH